MCLDAQHLPPPSQCSSLSFLRAAGPPERADLQTKVGERTRLHERALVGSQAAPQSRVSFTWPAMRLHIILAPWLTRFVWNACVRAQTVPDLKELCAQAGLPKTGKKQDLIDRLVQHPGGGFDGGGGAGAGARGDDGGGGGNAEGGGEVRRDRHGKIL